MTSRAMMKSAQEQWEALQKVTEAAQEVLPEGERQVLEQVTRNGATRTLRRLDAERTKVSNPPRDAELDDEVTEIREIRQVLRVTAGG